jgi:hypothetical protein
MPMFFTTCVLSAGGFLTNPEYMQAFVDFLASPEEITVAQEKLKIQLGLEGYDLSSVNRSKVQEDFVPMDDLFSFTNERKKITTTLFPSQKSLLSWLSPYLNLEMDLAQMTESERGVFLLDKESIRHKIDMMYSALELFYREYEKIKYQKNLKKKFVENKKLFTSKLVPFINDYFIDICNILNRFQGRYEKTYLNPSPCYLKWQDFHHAFWTLLIEMRQLREDIKIDIFQPDVCFSKIFNPNLGRHGSNSICVYKDGLFYRTFLTSLYVDDKSFYISTPSPGIKILSYEGQFVEEPGFLMISLGEADPNWIQIFWNEGKHSETPYRTTLMNFRSKVDPDFWNHLDYQGFESFPFGFLKVPETKEDGIYLAIAYLAEMKEEIEKEALSPQSALEFLDEHIPDFKMTREAITFETGKEKEKKEEQQDAPKEEVIDVINKVKKEIKRKFFAQADGTNPVSSKAEGKKAKRKKKPIDESFGLFQKSRVVKYRKFIKVINKISKWDEFEKLEVSSRAHGSHRSIDLGKGQASVGMVVPHRKKGFDGMSSRSGLEVVSRLVKATKELKSQQKK